MSEPMLELSIRITDGSYESKITLPTNATEADRKNFITQWLLLQDAGLKVLKGAGEP